MSIRHFVVDSVKLLMREDKRYDFEGSLKTMAEIRKLVPALAETSIRRHLSAGRNTRRLMLSRDSVALRSASAKRNSAPLRKLLDRRS
jgi:hypothetical protein